MSKVSRTLTVLSNNDVRVLKALVKQVENNRNNVLREELTDYNRTSSEEYFVKLDENDWIDQLGSLSINPTVFECKVYRLVYQSDSQNVNSTALTEVRKFEPIVNPDGSYTKVWVHNIHKVHIGRPPKDSNGNILGSYMKITRTRWGAWVFDFPSDFVVTRARVTNPGGIAPRQGSICGVGQCEIVDTPIAYTLYNTGKFIQVENWSTNVVGKNGNNYIVAGFTNGSWIVLSDDCSTVTSTSPGGGSGSGPGPASFNVPGNGDGAALSGRGSIPTAVTTRDFGSDATVFTGVQGTVSKILNDIALTGATWVEVTATLTGTLGSITLVSVTETPAAVTATLTKTLDGVTLVSVSDIEVIASYSATLESLTLVTEVTADLPSVDCSLSLALSAVTVTSSTSFSDIDCSLSNTLNSVTLSSSTTFVAAIDGTLNKTLDAVTLSSSGTATGIG